MNNKGLSRRDFLNLTTGAAAGTLLAACSAATPEVVEVEKVVTVEVEKEVEKVVTATAAPQREPATVEWWHQWGGTTGMAAMTAVEGAFNALENNITVERLHVTEMDQKLLAAIAGGTPPDIGVCCPAYAQYFVRGSFLPLDDYIEASSIVNKDEFVPGLFESMTWQGKTYGVPAMECGPRYGLIYNKTLVSEAGVDPDSPPQTLEELYDWHEAITKFDDAGNLDMLGFDPRDATAGNGPRTNIPMYWAIAYGLDIWDAENMTFHFDDDRFVSALDTIKRFTDYVGVEKMEAFRTSFGGWTQSPSSSFPSQVQSTIITGYYAPGEMATSSPDMDYGVSWAPVPAERAGVKFQSVGGHPAYVPLGAKEPDAAFEFIEYLTTDAVAEIMFNTTGWLPGRKAFYDPNRKGADRYAGLPWYLQSVAEADEFWAGPIIPVDGFVNQERNRTFDSVVYGEKTPEEAALAMQEGCTEELAQQFPELVG